MGGLRGGRAAIPSPLGHQNEPTQNPQAPPYLSPCFPPLLGLTKTRSGWVLGTGLTCGVGGCGGVRALPWPQG